MATTKTIERRTKAKEKVRAEINETRNRINAILHSKGGLPIRVVVGDVMTARRFKNRCEEIAADYHVTNDPGHKSTLEDLLRYKYKLYHFYLEIA